MLLGSSAWTSEGLTLLFGREPSCHLSCNGEAFYLGYFNNFLNFPVAYMDSLAVLNLKPPYCDLLSASSIRQARTVFRIGEASVVAPFP